MTGTLLDTTAVVAYLRGQMGLEGLLRRHDRVVVTPVVLGEVGLGQRVRGQTRDRRR